MRRARAWVWVLLPLYAALLACQTTPPTPLPVVTLSVGASTSAQPLCADLIAAYKQRAGHVTIAPDYADAQLTLDGLRAGRFQAALLSWPHAQPPGELWTQPVAMDALAVIVHPDNPVTALTLRELRDVFQGRTDVWTLPAGETLRIEVVSREDGASSRVLFERGVMGDQKVTLTAVLAPDSQSVVDYVAGHPGAIGYVSMAWVDRRVRALTLNGVAPGPQTARDQTYPLVTPIYFAAPGEPQGELRALYLYLIGPDGQAVVEQRYGRVQ